MPTAALLLDVLPFPVGSYTNINTRKDGVSLYPVYQRLDDPRYARLWTNAVKSTRSDFTEPTNSAMKDFTALILLKTVLKHKPR